MTTFGTPDDVNLYGPGGVGAMIGQALTRFPDRKAFVQEDREFTYAEVEIAIRTSIHRLKSLGLKRGDCFVQVTANRAEHWFVAAGAFIAGFKSVALHALGGAEDHLHIINDSNAVAVIFDKTTADKITAISSRCPGVRIWLDHDAPEGVTSLWALGELPQPLLFEAQTEDIVRLAYTGGTTGRAKGVMLSSRSLASTALLSLAQWDLPKDLRLVCAAPISHGAAALILPALCRGGTIFITDGFRVEAFVELVQTRRITGFFAVPSMLYALLDHPAAVAGDLSSVEFILYGGSPMSPTRVRQCLERFGPVLNQTYGQTEAPSCITLLNKTDHLGGEERMLSCGLPYAGLTVSLLGDDGDAVAPHQVGEICVRGPHVMSGYWKQPEQTAEAFKGGWLHTGDLAYANEEGYIFLVDRKKDVIISGGFNVYPKEVEDALMRHPGIVSAAVIGVPDRKWGEAVKAFVVRRPDMIVEVGELRSHVRALKGAINTPKTIDFVEEIPLTPVGKPDKKILRKPFWSDQGRQIG